jgi:hypothetical protein
MWAADTEMICQPYPTGQAMAMPSSHQPNSRHFQAASTTFSTITYLKACTSVARITSWKVARVRMNSSSETGPNFNSSPCSGRTLLRLRALPLPPAGDSSVQIGDAHSTSAPPGMLRMS